MAYGGAEVQVVHLASHLKERGWDVLVISIRPPQAFVDRLEAQGIPVYSLGLRGGYTFPKAFMKLIGLLRREKVDVLHTHMFHANILGRLARLFVRIPAVIGTVHATFEGEGSKERRRILAYRLTDRLADCTTNVSQAGAERYVNLDAVAKTRSRYIPNGVDANCFSPNPEDRRTMRVKLGFTEEQFLWLAVGRFDIAKDYGNMLRAFARLVAQYENARLMIAGTGNRQHEYERLAHELGIESHVKFLGLRKDVVSLMRAADGFVMSSAHEGMPMVLLEAGATGLPIVSTDVGGISVIVRDRETGFLVPPRDDLALAKGMLELMGLSHSERSKLAMKARAHILTYFSLERVVDEWEAIYREFI